MKVTCSILCYNYGRFLKQAIDSCLNQTRGDYELDVLVIDDGSTDETPEVCALYEGRIRVLRSENCGFGPTIDKAIREAHGEWVCLLDADDFFAPDKIVTLLPHMKEGVLYIQHKKFRVGEDGKRLDDRIDEDAGNTSTVCVRRSAALTLLPTLNEIFFHPLRDAGHGFECDEPLAFYRVHGASMLNSGSKVRWLRHHADVCRTLADRLFSPGLNVAWATTRQKKRIGSYYRTLQFFDETEAALLTGAQAQAIKSSCKMLKFAVFSYQGIESWQLKVAVRSLIGRSMYAGVANATEDAK